MNIPEGLKMFHTYTLPTQSVSVVNATVQRSTGVLNSVFEPVENLTKLRALSGYEALKEAGLKLISTAGPGITSIAHLPERSARLPLHHQSSQADEQAMCLASFR